MAGAVEAKAVAGLVAAGIGLVGDDADRAGLRTGTVQGALRTGQHLDARDVVDVDVERALDRRHRLLVEVDADARQRPGMVAVAAAGDATHVDLRKARTETLVGHGGQELHVVLEIRDVEFAQLFVAEHLDADRHVLQVFGALLRGHRDHVQGRRAGRALVGLLGRGALRIGRRGDRKLDRCDQWQSGHAQRTGSGTSPGSFRVHRVSLVLSGCYRFSLLFSPVIPAGTSG